METPDRVDRETGGLSAEALHGYCSCINGTFLGGLIRRELRRTITLRRRKTLQGKKKKKKEKKEKEKGYVAL